jgi:formylmethanofuran dehydrogenase subunit C
LSQWVFSLRSEPDQRVNLSRLIPDNLSGTSQKEVESWQIGTTRHVIKVGDLFRVRKGTGTDICFAGGSRRFDRIGELMSDGSIVVEGEAGARAGRNMRGGRLAIKGDAGPFAGSGMSGGDLKIEGSAGDWLAGPLAGELAGMRGGTIHVKGNAGQEAGHRLRRGTIVICGNVGDYAARSMIAGTLICFGRAGTYPGYLMRRGSILLARPPAQFAPTFVDCGLADYVFTRLLLRSLDNVSAAASRLYDRALRRMAGDLAVAGKGEILLPV